MNCARIYTHIVCMTVYVCVCAHRHAHACVFVGVCACMYVIFLCQELCVYWYIILHIRCTETYFVTFMEGIICLSCNCYVKWCTVEQTIVL